MNLLAGWILLGLRIGFLPMFWVILKKREDLNSHLTK